MSDHEHLSRRIREGRFRRRESVTESINSSPATILLNMSIELIGVLVLMFGVVYLVRFLFACRVMMDDMHFKFFLVAIVFMAVGWCAHIGIKLRSYLKNYRAAIARREGRDHHLSE